MEKVEMMNIGHVLGTAPPNKGCFDLTKSVYDVI